MSFSASEVRSLFSVISDLYRAGDFAEAEGKLLVLENAFQTLQEDNLDLRLELRAAQESLKDRFTMKYEAPFYFLFDGERKNGPFCQRCYEVDSKKVHLIEHSFALGTHRCNACDTYYGPPRETAVGAATTHHPHRSHSGSGG